MMRLALDPFRLLLISLAGWLNQRQQDVIDYLQEENRVLREQLGAKRLRFNDDQRRRLAVRAKNLGWRLLSDLTTIVTPATLLARHRERNHQGLDNRLIIHEQLVADSAAAIQRCSRLGGMLNYYYRQAA